MHAKDLAALLGLGALWGSSYVFIRLAVPSFGPAALVAARVLLGALLLGGFAAATRRRPPFRAHWGRLLVLGALNAALPFMLIATAELHITAGLAAVLNATTPLFAAVFAAFLLGERLTVPRAVGLVVGIAGVGIMVGWSPVPLSLSTWLAVGAMLVAAASYAASGIYVRLRMSGVPVFTLALGQQLGALAWLAAPAMFWAPRAMPPGRALLAVSGLGVLCTALAYLLYFRLLERVGPTKTSTVTYLLPVFGVAWSTLLLDEPVTGGMVAGFAVILLGVGLVNGTSFGTARLGARAS